MCPSDPGPTQPDFVQLRIDVRIIDRQALHDYARRRYQASSQPHPPSSDDVQAVLEALVLSNENPSPADYGIEIVAIKPSAVADRPRHRNDRRFGWHPDHLTAGPQSSEARPLLRTFRPDDNSGVRIQRLSVPELMTENECFEESAEMWALEVLDHGSYDDSDSQAGVICLYHTDDPAALRRQLTAWQEQHHRPGEQGR